MKTQNPRCPRGGKGSVGLGSHLLAVLTDHTGRAPRPQLLPAEDAAVDAVAQHAAPHVLQPRHQAPAKGAQGVSGVSGKGAGNARERAGWGVATAFGPAVPFPDVTPHGDSPSPAMRQNHIPAEIRLQQVCKAQYQLPDTLTKSRHQPQLHGWEKSIIQGSTAAWSNLSLDMNLSTPVPAAAHEELKEEILGGL